MILYGKLYEHTGQQLVSGGDPVIVTAKLDGQAVAVYALGAHPDAADDYVIRIQREQGTSGTIRLFIDDTEVIETRAPNSVAVSSAFTDVRELDLHLPDLDTDDDDLPDEWEVEFLGGLGFDGDDDPDFDGIPNADEHAAGSDPYGWAVELTVDNASPATVTFGVHGFATDDYEAGYDVLYDDTRALGHAYFVDTGDNLEVNVKSAAAEQQWDLWLVPDDDEITVSWPGVPGALLDRLHWVEIDGNGQPLSPVLPFADGQPLVVAGEPGLYRILFTPHAVKALLLVEGWNLISLPVRPPDPAICTLFRRKNLGAVWRWDGTHYVKVKRLATKTGYWVYFPSPFSVLVQGVAETDRQVALAPGWNLVGPTQDGVLPTAAGIRRPVWTWTPGRGLHRATDLRELLGYWIFLASGGVVIVLM